MPSLPKSEAAAVDEFEGNEYPLLEPGLYNATLFDVDGSKEGPAGPYWRWEFHAMDSNNKFWTNTSLSEKARFKMKEMFDAFGVPADTNTDLLCGKPVTLQVGIGTINSGEKQGQQRNEVVKVLPFQGSDDVEELEEF